MRTRTWTVLTLNLIWISNFAFAGATLYPGKILSVADGDTVRVQTQSKVLKVRFIGIDTPETHLSVPGGTYGQGHWGDDAALYLAQIIPVGTEVVVHSYGIDNYGRTLGRVFKGKMDVNLEMLRSGWASLYSICGKNECHSRMDFDEQNNFPDAIKACKEAMAAGRGIFNPKDPLKEMPFEFRMRLQKRKPSRFVGDQSNQNLKEPADYPSVTICDRVFFDVREDAIDLGFGK